MCFNFFSRMYASNSKVKCWLIVGGIVFFLLLVGILSIKRAVKEFATDVVTVKSLASWGIGVQGSAVKYTDLKTNFLVSPKIVVNDLVVDTLYASLKVDQLVFSYGFFSKNSTIGFSDGNIYVSNGNEKGDGYLRCKVGSALSIEWQDSMAFYLLKRILFGKKVSNSVNKVSYVDDNGTYCTNQEEDGGALSSAYEKMRIELSFSEDDTLKVDAFLSMKGQESIGSLSLNMDDILVRKNHDNGSTEINIPSLGLKSESFSARLYGEMLISQKCALMSFRRCQYNMNLEIKEFDELSKFMKAGMSKLLMGEFSGNSKSTEHLMSFWNALFEAVRASAQNEEDVTKITLNSTEKDGLMVGGIPINRMIGDIVKKFGSIKM